MKSGQPTKYSKTMLAAAREYISSCTDEEQFFGAGTFVKNKLKVNLPTVEGLAVHLKVHKDTLYEWSEKHEAFSDVLGELMAEQGKRLINNSLSGDYNAPITKLLLSKHGYVEKSEKDITSNGKTLAALISEIDD